LNSVGWIGALRSTRRPPKPERVPLDSAGIGDPASSAVTSPVESRYDVCLAGLQRMMSAKIGTGLGG
jgi:hypothetical protein